ncbi:hypothetical protein N658DRAFT_84547 [Parathielavia hyrcaniae]|uniref:Uncharacterized protein n=1 Tax=Parathielavia hyrcaniae TaxID=113614 RepID=A0AAN6Q222_9PEZI|nr:hypothetical protein N658DRAFT_84547 [Parathielavia hyrcaniae]
MVQAADPLVFVAPLPLQFLLSKLTHFPLSLFASRGPISFPQQQQRALRIAFAAAKGRGIPNRVHVYRFIVHGICAKKRLHPVFETVLPLRGSPRFFPASLARLAPLRHLPTLTAAHGPDNPPLLLPATRPRPPNHSKRGTEHKKWLSPHRLST